VEYKPIYIRFGNSFVVYDPTRREIVTECREVGVILHIYSGVSLYHGEYINAKSFYQRLVSDKTPNLRILHFSVFDSTNLLNQIVTDCLAAQLLMVKDGAEFNLIKAASRN
jgi:hypothetical protein